MKCMSVVQCNLRLGVRAKFTFNILLPRLQRVYAHATAMCHNTRTLFV